MKGDKERCLKAGMDDYISKPIEPQELIDAIEKWTSSYSQQEVIKEQAYIKNENQLSGVPIEFESAINRFCGDRGFFEKMLTEFLDYVPKQIKKLDQAVKKGDIEAVDREAHSLKGLAAQLSVNGLADLSLNLELLGRTGNLAGAKDELDKMRTEFQHLKEYINNSLHHEIAVNS
jgi:HPt (histidine-containing phosphotransfer) domain-containing protein